MFTKDFIEAGKLFLPALMTFTNYELFDYKKFVFYTVVTNIFHVERNILHSLIMENSDVVACLKDIPNVGAILEAFYNGDYKKFFEVFRKIKNI